MTSKLRQFVDQLLAQRGRMKDEQEQYAAILAAAVADGFDKKALQELIKRLCADEKTVRQQDELLELYEAEYRKEQAA
jgi:uncharacterized protein (UPF0335 family)